MQILQKIAGWDKVLKIWICDFNKDGNEGIKCVS